MSSGEPESPVEEEREERPDPPQSWAGYSWSLVKRVGYGTYSAHSSPLSDAAAYYLGGKLSYLFGITTPDWQYAIDIHEDMEREAREEREEEERALRHLEERRMQRLRLLESQEPVTVNDQT